MNVQPPNTMLHQGILRTTVMKRETHIQGLMGKVVLQPMVMLCRQYITKRQRRKARTEGFIMTRKTISTALDPLHAPQSAQYLSLPF
jgi:glucose-6-phosphate-specific signal transduction histidine kinase